MESDSCVREPSLADPKVFRQGYEHVRANDPKLRTVLDNCGIIKFKPGGDIFESLVESIISQQLSGAAADAIIRKVRNIYRGGRLEPKTLQSTPADMLRGAGVSPQKLSYLKDFSSRVASGELALDGLRRLPDDEILRRLDETRGIGPWTVQMLLIFTLGRPDVLPVDDFGIRKGIQLVYHLDDLPKKDAIRGIAERWHPFCTVASLYLWRCKDDGTAAAKA